MNLRLQTTLLLSIALILFSYGGNFVHAAEQPPIQKAFENVKDSLDSLVTAKDNAQDDLALRIATFKKILDLAITEAQDLKLKLLNFDQFEDEALAAWGTEMLDSLKNGILYYEKQKQYIEKYETTIDLSSIKLLAEEFKAWRETNYLETAGQIRDFLLLKQEEKAIIVAERRLSKITEDIKKLEGAKIKGIGELQKLLQNAEQLIEKSAEINARANDAFWKNYVIKPTLIDDTLTTTSTATSTSTSTTPQELQENSTGTLSTPPLSSAPLITTSSSSEIISTTTVPIIPPPSLTSIKDLVKDSLNKIKDAYQIFIEMSNLVRELLK